MRTDRGYNWYWRCTCGCGSGLFTLFGEENQTEDYCRLNMSWHVEHFMLKDVLGLKDGKHQIVLLKKVKAMVKVVEEDWT